MTQPVAINQRDLRLRSREIMDAVEAGESFTVTRDGRDIGQLVPLPRRRRFVSRADFAASSAEAATPDLTAWRRQEDAAYDVSTLDPYGR